MNMDNRRSCHLKYITALVLICIVLHLASRIQRQPIQYIQSLSIRTNKNTPSNNIHHEKKAQVTQQQHRHRFLNVFSVNKSSVNNPSSRTSSIRKKLYPIDVQLMFAVHSETEAFDDSGVYRMLMKAMRQQQQSINSEKDSLERRYIPQQDVNYMYADTIPPLIERVVKTQCERIQDVNCYLVRAIVTVFTNGDDRVVRKQVASQLSELMARYR